MRAYAQVPLTIWQYSGSLAAAGSMSSGSYPCLGYARLTGMLYSSASAESASGLRIYQSSDYGQTWDYWYDSVPTAISGSAYSVEVVGNTIKVNYKTDSAAASVRLLFALRPI